MITKKEWKEAAERRLAENLALKILVREAEKILSVPIEDLGQARRRIRRAKHKLEVAKEI